jgi:hypothetical protein
VSAGAEPLAPRQFALAQQVADAVLYEGYILYPYRASATKNRLRWQFGVVVPRGYAEPAQPAAPGGREAGGDGPPAGTGEPWSMQTECLAEPLAGRPADDTAEPVPPAGAFPGPRVPLLLDLRLRFLQLQSRQVEEAVPGSAGGEDGAERRFRPVASLVVGGQPVLTWEEGKEVLVDHTGIDLDRLLGGELVLPLDVAGGREIEPLAENARLVRERWPIRGRLRLAAEPAGGLVRLRVRIENLTPWAPGAAARDNAPAEGAARGNAPGQGAAQKNAAQGTAAQENEPGGERSGLRELAMRQSLLGAHTLLGLRGGSFISLLDPPPAAADAAAACANQHTWPVLIGAEGDRQVMLSSPIILYDYPAVAPESPGDLCDATEIDEILTLRVMTLTEDEKREARGTDERARQIVERSDHMPPEVLDRLHGALRYLGGGPAGSGGGLAVSASGGSDAAGGMAVVSPAAGLAATAEGGSAMGAAAEAETPPADGWCDRVEEGLAAEWQAFLNPPGEPAPEDAWVEIGGARVGRGSRLRLCPTRRADSMDTFLVGRTGRVAAVYRSLDDETYLAVTVEDDPAAELHGWFGRFFYFQPDEVEVLEAAAAVPPEEKGDKASCAT